MPLSNLITTTISLDTIRAVRAGYGKPMLCAVHTTFAEDARTYTELAGMVTDGFLTTDELYLATVVLLSQKNRPTSWTIGKRATPVAQVDTVTVVGVGDGDYTVTINSVDHTFAAASKTATEIRDELVIAINAGSEPVTASDNSTDALDVTADVAGEPFTITVASPASDMTITPVTPNAGLYQDLVAIRAADATWWGFADITHTDPDNMEGSRWMEIGTGLFVPQSNAADIKATGSDDMASLLMGFSRVRTAPVYHANDSAYADAAYLGQCLPKDAGSINWAWQPLAGITADTLTSAEVAFIKAKNANWIENLGQTVALNGITSGGQYIDIIRGRDWLESNMNQDFADLLTSMDKLPMTEEGVAVADTTIEARLLRGVQQGIIAPGGYVVGLPVWDDITDEDKAARRLVRTFTATIQGAVSELTITGILSL